MFSSAMNKILTAHLQELFDTYKFSRIQLLDIQEKMIMFAIEATENEDVRLFLEDYKFIIEKNDQA